MNLAQAHLDIARERFLELMAAEPGRNAEVAAATAISDADKFAELYENIGYAPSHHVPEPVKTKGCRACYGSGGKVGHPCAKCGGTGKVIVE